MILRPLKNVAGTGGHLTGTGFIRTDSHAMMFGGALIAADGVNCAEVKIRKDNPTGDIIFYAKTHAPQSITGPFFVGSKLCYYEIAGTGASAQLFEWVP